MENPKLIMRDTFTVNFFLWANVSYGYKFGIFGVTIFFFWVKCLMVYKFKVNVLQRYKFGVFGVIKKFEINMSRLT